MQLKLVRLKLTLTLISLGLVPKSNGDLRLIFDLSHGGERSVNAQTPKHLCTTVYKPFEYAVRMVLRADKKLRELCKQEGIKRLHPYMGKSDLKSAFRFL